MFSLFGNSGKSRAREVVSRAQMMAGIVSPSKLLRFEARVPRRSPKWNWIVTALATYSALRVVAANADDATYQKVLTHVPGLIESELGHEYALAFVDLFSVLFENHKKGKQITADLLGQWAISKLSHEEFPSEIDIPQIAEMHRIGEELLQVVNGSAGFTSPLFSRKPGQSQ